jgi:hypothetical protein
MAKKSNEYAHTIGSIIERTPKTVLAAIVVSLIALRGDSDGNEIAPDDSASIVSGIVGEWNALHRAGIIPQRPPILTR